MRKHTPGPWGSMAGPSDDETIAWTPIQGKLEPAPGLTIGSPHNTEPICRVFGYMQPVVANARLIAAAPEMYEALILAQGELEGLPEELRERWKGYETGKRKRDIDLAQAAVDAIRAAISKAKGKGRGQ